jgi:hypothetical protein
MTRGERAVRVVAATAPALMAAAFVLLGYVYNAVPIDQLWRPLLVAMAIAVAVQAIAIVALGWLRGSFWAFVAVCLLTGFFLVGGASVLALTLFGVVGRGNGRQYRLAGLLATAVSVSFLMFAIVPGIVRGAFDWEPIALSAPEVGTLTAGPNIHLLLLDGYPRQDVLESVGFDNEAFLSAMAERGFEVYPESRSNYERTPFSLLTLLTLRHLDDIHELDGTDAVGGKLDQERIAARALLGVPAFDLAEQAGYHTRVVKGSVVHAPIGGADEVTSAGSATNFELDTIQRTPLAVPLEVVGVAMSQARAQVTGALDVFARPPDSPAFTFTHVLAPHAPFSFEADGSTASAPPCYPESCAIFDGQDEGLGWTDEEHWQHMVNHVAHLNDLVTDAVDGLLAADPEAVIVIFGDHGMRIGEDPQAVHRNLLLARTPGQPGLFGEAPTLVNVLPQLFNAYLGGDAKLLADEIYDGGEDPWFDVMPYGSAEAP